MFGVGKPRTTPCHREPLSRPLVLHGEWFFFNSKGYTAYGGIPLHKREPRPNREPPRLRMVPDVLGGPDTHASRSLSGDPRCYVDFMSSDMNNLSIRPPAHARTATRIDIAVSNLDAESWTDVGNRTPFCNLSKTPDCS